VHFIWNKEACILPAKYVQPSFSLSIQGNRAWASIFSAKWLVIWKVGVLRPFKAQWLLQTSPALAIHEFHFLPTRCVFLCSLWISKKKGGLFTYTKLTGFFSGAFAKLRKVTTKFVTSVVRIEQLCSHGRISMIFYMSNFLKSSEIIQVWLTTDNNKGYFTWKHVTFMITFRWILLVMRNALDKLYIENQNTFYI